LSAQCTACTFAQNLKKQTMKTITLGIILFLFIAFSAKAEGDRYDFINDIHNFIEYPEFAKTSKEQGTVLVKIFITEKGLIQICESNSDNLLLQQWLVNQLSTITIKDPTNFNTEQYLKFDFKLI
jgi:hypothetical protein